MTQRWNSSFESFAPQALVVKFYKWSAMERQRGYSSSNELYQVGENEI